MISKFQSFWLVLVVSFCIVLLAGCGDTFRQFITPIPGPTGDPAALSHAVVTSNNPTATGLGSDMHIDVGGDSLVGNVNLGHNPLFFNSNQGRAFIVNGDGTLTLYTGLLPLTTGISTATLPLTTSGAVAAGAGSNGGIYVANSGSNNVSFIPITTTAVTQVIPTGTKPVMVAGGNSPNIYVVNNASNDVTVISTIDNTVQKTIPVGLSPVWAVMSSDGEGVFVVNQGDGTLSFIDTTVNQEICGSGGAIVPCTSGNRIKVGSTSASSPNFAFYDSPRRRVYVTNIADNSVSVINANGINFGVTPPVLPTFVKNIAVTGSPLSVTALRDGSKVYAALGNCTDPATNHTNLQAHLPNCNGNQVSVIDAVALAQSRTITVGPGAVSVDSSADSSRVYVVSAHDITTIRDDVHAPNCTDANCVPGAPLPDRTFVTPSVYVIKAATDTPIVTPVNSTVVSLPLPTFHVPQQDPNCVPAKDLAFNDEVPLPTCALQIPFMVRVIP